MANKKEQENYLDYIPAVSPENTWEEKDGKVTINMVNKGFYNKIAQKFFDRPRVSHIDLDEQGSFVFLQIDGERTLQDIALRVREKYAEEDRVLYARLVRYMQILRNNKFIYFKGKDKMPK